MVTNPQCLSINIIFVLQRKNSTVSHWRKTYCCYSSWMNEKESMSRSQLEVPYAFVNFSSYLPRSFRWYRPNLWHDEVTEIQICILSVEILFRVSSFKVQNYFQVNTQLYSSREKADLAHLVCIMIAYNMTYHQEKTPEGQYSYVLDP